MANTVDVTGTIKDQFDLPIPMAKCTVELDRTDVDHGYVAPVYTTAVTDENGQFTMALWPNQRGARASKYKFTAQHPTTGKVLIKTTFVVPYENSTGDPVSTVNIFEIADLEPFEGKSDAQVALEVLQAEAAAAHTARAITETKADEASVSAANALASENAANAHQTAAKDYFDQTVINAAEAEATINTIRLSASNAATSEANAATSEANAATSETNAATSESNAATSASSSASSASASLASEAKAKKWAENNKDVAVESGLYSAKHHALKAAASATFGDIKATEAEASAVTAQEQADSATASATTATTKAAEAVVSAQAAASSASSAATEASTAMTKASAASASETNAASSAAASAASASNANDSKNASAASEANAATSANQASTSAATAATEAANALASANTATTQASNASVSAASAASSLQAAQTVQTATEASEQSALLASEQIYSHVGMFSDTTAGLASTVDTDYFTVPGTDNNFVSLYLNNAGSAELVSAVYSVAKIDEITAKQEQQVTSAFVQAAAISQLQASLVQSISFPD